MSSPDDQLTLDDLLGFDPEEGSKESYANVDQAHAKAEKILSDWLSKPRRSKKSMVAAVDVVSEFLLSGTSSDDLKYVMSHPSPMLKDSKEITVDNVQKALKDMDFHASYVKVVKEAERILSSWSKKSGRTKQAVANAVESFSNALIQGVDAEDLKYVISHNRPMLKDSKIITSKSLATALDTVDDDRAKGSLSLKIFNEWYEQYYVGNYTQTPGSIVGCIKRGLLSGVKEDDIIIALNILGKARQVITINSLQYALTRVDKINHQRYQAGSNAHDVDYVTQEEMFAARRSNIDSAEQNFDDLTDIDFF